MAHVIEEKDMHPDFGEMPASKGVPLVVKVAATVGIIMIFCIGGWVVLASSYGHLWPANHTLRADLGSRPNK